MSPWPQLPEQGDDSDAVLKAAAPPAAANFIGQYFSSEDSGTQKLCLRKIVLLLFSSGSRDPNSEVPIVTLWLGNAGLRQKWCDVQQWKEETA